MNSKRSSLPLPMAKICCVLGSVLRTSHWGSFDPQNSPASVGPIIVPPVIDKNLRPPIRELANVRAKVWPQALHSRPHVISSPLMKWMVTCQIYSRWRWISFHSLLCFPLHCFPVRHLWIASHTSRMITPIISTSERLIFRWRNWGIESWSDLSMATPE